MANDITDRIKEIINYKQLNVSSFESKIGASNGQIAKAIARKSALKSDLLDSILEFCPEINANWLVTGKGEMLRHDAPTATTEPQNDSLSALISILQSTITEKDRQIQHLLDIIHSLTSNKIQ